MTTINTIEDLLRLLDQNPQWVDALRARLLTRELIELPEKVAQFAATTSEKFGQIDASFERVNEKFDQVDAKFDQVDARFDQVDARFERVDARFDQVDARFERIEQRLGRVETVLERNQVDLGYLKGAHARNVAIGDAGEIAASMGLRWNRNLDWDDLRRLADAADTSAIATGDLRSFRRADLIIEATDRQGETCYIATEISFTANGRDTDRAVRNARFLQDFTGQRSYPAIAGLRLDERIQTRVDAGEVFWHELDSSDLEAE